MAYIDEDLEKIKLKIRTEEEKTQSVYEEIGTNLSFGDFFTSQITNNNLKTMGMHYNKEIQTVKIQVIEDNMTNERASFVNYTMRPQDYTEFCKSIGLNPDAHFNDSANPVIEGVNVRVFAYVKPYSEFPNLVFSTAKRPPDKINTLTKDEEKLLEEVLQSNFIIVGASGAGKTYLLNYLLQKYYPKDQRVGIFQEFMELFDPNEYTDQIVIPPRKPDQSWNDLEYIVEQSNLGRYKSIFVGEIKGPESWPFVVNLASGTSGGATIHGVDAQSALKRLRTLCLLSRTNLAQDAVDSFISAALDYVITVEDGQVVSVDRVLMTNHGKFSLQNLMGSNNN